MYTKLSYHTILRASAQGWVSPSTITAALHTLASLDEAVLQTRPRPSQLSSNLWAQGSRNGRRFLLKAHVSQHMIAMAPSHIHISGVLLPQSNSRELAVFSTSVTTA